MSCVILSSDRVLIKKASDLLTAPDDREESKLVQMVEIEIDADPRVARTR